MQNIIAFFTVLIVWSTTPLAIKFASMGASAFFAAGSRMFIAVLVCFLILSLKRQHLNFATHKNNYFLAGAGIFVTLSLVYIAALKINSGMIAIIFAITPLMTGVISNVVFKNKEFNFHKLIATLVGFAGMIIIFLEYANFTDEIFSLFLLFLGMSFQAFISVKLKSIQSTANALQTTTGGLLISVPFFIISFILFETHIPSISNVAIIATLYLAIFGSVLGFISYYFLIKNVSVLTVGIIPLITPIFALILGYYLNDEIINTTQMIGFVVVLFSLIYFQFYDKFTDKFTKIRSIFSKH